MCHTDIIQFFKIIFLKESRLNMEHCSKRLKRLVENSSHLTSLSFRNLRCPTFQMIKYCVKFDQHFLIFFIGQIFPKPNSKQERTDSNDSWQQRKNHKTWIYTVSEGQHDTFLHFNSGCIHFMKTSAGFDVTKCHFPFLHEKEK